MLPSGNIAILFTQFGPYHHARVKALQDALPGQIFPAQIAAASKTYAWTQSIGLCDGLVTLCDGIEEDASPSAVILAACCFLKTHKIHAVFLPSYSPAHVFALYAAAVYCGCRRIMMNESHAGTERATGLKRTLKKIIVRGFHAALVGGTPQKRHFQSLGIPESKIFTGYDAIDNDYFFTATMSARQDASELRGQLGLPDRYFLSLGRFVAKKDLATLIRAFAAFRKNCSESVDLVMVGSGELETSLIELARSLGLLTAMSKSGLGSHHGLKKPEPIAIVTGNDATTVEPVAPKASAYGSGEMRFSSPEASAYGSGKTPTVHFMGFRQIDQNPLFYALAEAFVLPSVEEEWGLVVNEAMACGLPVIVSRAVGCAEDLVSHGENGFLFDPGDVNTLSIHMKRLAEDPLLRSSMGHASQTRIEDWGCERFAANAMLAIKAAFNRQDGER